MTAYHQDPQIHNFKEIKYEDVSGHNFSGELTNVGKLTYECQSHSFCENTPWIRFQFDRAVPSKFTTIY